MSHAKMYSGKHGFLSRVNSCLCPGSLLGFYKSCERRRERGIQREIWQHQVVPIYKFSLLR